MKLHPSFSLFLLLLPALATAAADVRSNSESTIPAVKSSYDSNSRYVDADSLLHTAGKGSLDVPVDGKDGRPHAGPWVETSAERDRKGYKSSDDVDAVSTKYDTKMSSASEHLSVEEGKAIPRTNDGVMDDPRRASPKQGTRGTEGGVSEKRKDNIYDTEKVPGSPKEVPPLPHSETKKLSTVSDSSAGSGGRSADDTGSLGMLEVRRSLENADNWQC